MQLLFRVVAEAERIATGKRGRFVSTESITTVYWAILVVAALVLIVALLLRRSRHGLALQSIGVYEEAAAHSGVNIMRTKILVFAPSSVFMGMAEPSSLPGVPT